MIRRTYWENRIAECWKKVPITWLTGVRRIGKTTLAQSFGEALYINCDLPSVSNRLDDPEGFFASIREPCVILDEVHQLSDPSRVLKIAADGFPNLKVLATGSSTLSATQKFRDSLTGRKRVVHLLPVLAEELEAFGCLDVRRRLLHGGLPQLLMSEKVEVDAYAEWMDSFYARDVQELFRIEKRAGFLLLLQIILRQSGSLFESTNLAKLTALSRPTVQNYLNVLQVMHAVRIIRPYAAGGRREIIAQPKVFGFDTGFVAYAHGWNELRNEDCGMLWEHLILDTLLSIENEENIYFWRDKQQREVDFVIPRGRSQCDAIECKWKSESFEPRGLKAFRENYQNGRNFLLASNVVQPYSRNFGGFEVTVANAQHLRGLLALS